MFDDPIITANFILGIVSMLVSLGTCIHHVVTVRARAQHDTGVVITKEYIKEDCNSAELDAIKNKYNDKGDDSKKHGHHEVIHDKTTYAINFSDIGEFEQKIDIKKNGNANASPRNMDYSSDKTPITKGIDLMPNINILKPKEENEIKINYLEPQQVFNQNQAFSKNATDHRVEVLDHILEAIKLEQVNTPRHHIELQIHAPKHHIELSGNENLYNNENEV